MGDKMGLIAISVSRVYNTYRETGVGGNVPLFYSMLMKIVILAWPSHAFSPLIPSNPDAVANSSQPIPSSSFTLFYRRMLTQASNARFLSKRVIA